MKRRVLTLEAALALAASVTTEPTPRVWPVRARDDFPAAFVPKERTVQHGHERNTGAAKAKRAAKKRSKR